MNLKEKTLLVQLNTSHWAARKYDKKVTREIDEAHNAHQAGRFNKTLILSDLLSAVNACLGKARSYHYEVTMPWDDSGQRLLPVEKYFEYTKKMQEFQLQHKTAVDTFLREYPDLREQAKERLNTLFNEGDYPDARALAGKFNLSYRIIPIADSDDLRISMSEEEAKEIRKNIEDGLNERVHNAKNNLVERAITVIEALHERLKDNTATFRDSLIGNVVSLAELLPSMNFDNDPKFDWMIKQLNKFNIPPINLRKDMELRQATVKRAKKLLKKLNEITYGDVVREVPVKEEKPKKKKKTKKVKRVKRVRK